MAKATLPVNFKDDILNSSMNGKRRYNLIQNSDGTVSLEDVSTYDQVGSNFGAGNINAINQAVNESFDKNKIVKSLDDISAITESGYAPDALALKEVNDSLGGLTFAQDNEGKWGYKPSGADAVIPFNAMKTYKYVTGVTISYPEKSGNYICEIDLKNVDKILIFMNYNNAANSSAIKLYFDNNDMGKLSLPTNYIWTQFEYDVSTYNSMKFEVYSGNNAGVPKCNISAYVVCIAGSITDLFNI